MNSLGCVLIDFDGLSKTVMCKVIWGNRTFELVAGRSIVPKIMGRVDGWDPASYHPHRRTTWSAHPAPTAKASATDLGLKRVCQRCNPEHDIRN